MRARLGLLCVVVIGCATAPVRDEDAERVDKTMSTGAADKPAEGLPYGQEGGRAVAPAADDPYLAAYGAYPPGYSHTTRTHGGAEQREMSRNMRSGNGAEVGVRDVTVGGSGVPDVNAGNTPTPSQPLPPMPPMVTPPTPSETRKKRVMPPTDVSVPPVTMNPYGT